MGLSPSACRLLIKHHHQYPLTGPLLTLGNQDVFGSYHDLQRWFREQSCTAHSVAPETHTSDYFARVMPDRARDFVHARTLFAMMGVDEYADMDLLPMDEAQITHDLNRPVPDALQNRFETVLDAGTCEHIFDVRQSLGNIVRMCRVGGQVLHLSPAKNYLDHGFYAISPTLFFDFYRANGFEIETCWIWQVNRDKYFETCPYFAYSYGMDTRPFLDPQRYAYTFFAARKIMEVENIRVPMQGYYSSVNGEENQPQPPDQIRAMAPLARRLVAPLLPLARRIFPLSRRLERI